jgi:hypothetical protein
VGGAAVTHSRKKVVAEVEGSAGGSGRRRGVTTMSGSGLTPTVEVAVAPVIEVSLREVGVD